MKNSYYKDTGLESELEVIVLINRLCNDNYIAKKNINNYDVDIQIYNIKEEKIDINIESEIIDPKSNSNWKKGNCWWCDKKGFNKNGEPYGIHIPHRKTKYFNQYPESFWLKSNREYNSWIVIKASYILKQKHQNFRNFRQEYGKELYYFYESDMKKNNAGMCDVSLEEALKYIEKSTKISFLKHKIEWNVIKYIDCLDELEGLPSLPDQSIEVCFTDPPYNISYKGKKKQLLNGVKEEIYEDDNPYYKEWCRKWFYELERICYGSILIHCGNPNLNMWISDIKKPKGILWHYKEDVQSQDSIAHLMKLTPILIYGNLKKRFKINPIKIKNKYDKRRGTLKHPAPLNLPLLQEILERLKPKSVIDPFMGSGTTAICCSQLDILYIGYEINKNYKLDYEKEKEQKRILNFLL